MTGTDRSVAGLLDQARFGPFQVRVVAICFAVAALDGFDTQSIAFVAPALLHAWDVPRAMFGPLFGAGLLGAMFGSIIFGSLADRFGRKPLLLCSTAVFGALSLLCATAKTLEVLAVYRFLAGLGLGGAIPNIIALVSEYAPTRARSTVIVATFAGFPGGAIAGGMLSTWMIPTFGWQSVFLAGGILPLLLLPVILAGVPESLRFLILRRPGSASIARITSRLGPGFAAAAAAAGTAGHPPAKQSVRELFAAGRARWTALLWLLTFTAMVLAYFLVNWTPLLLVGAGVAQGKAIMAVVLLNLGGIVGSLVLGRISDRRRPFVAVGAAFGIGSAVIVTLSQLIGSSVPALLGLIFAVGLCVFGAQLNITALTARYYPVRIRSTGIGWGMAVGRVGSFVGPTLGGPLVALGLGNAQLFLCAAIPAALACLVVGAMSFHVPPVEHEEPSD